MELVGVSRLPFRRRETMVAEATRRSGPTRTYISDQTDVKQHCALCIMVSQTSRNANAEEEALGRNPYGVMIASPMATNFSVSANS